MIKYGDGKAQAFNKWFKEYVMNVILQPVHLLLYMSLVGAASDLVARNPIYALVAIGFLIPAEKFIKDMFGLNKATSTGDFGSFAQGALALKGLQSVGKALTGKSGNGGNSVKGGSFGGNEAEEAKFNKIRRAELGAYAVNKQAKERKEENEENEDSINTRMKDQKELLERQQHQMRLNEINQEKERLGQELDDYQNNGEDIYSSTDPAIQDKQLRYQELEEQEKQERLAFQQAQAQRELEEQEKQRNQIRNNVGSSNQHRKGYVGRLAVRGFKAGVKGVFKGAKMATKVAGTGIGATIGVASAIMQGNPANLGKYMAAGAVAGGAIGSGLAELPGRAVNAGKGAYEGVRSLGDSISNAIHEERDGYQVAREQRIEKGNQRARKEFLRDKNQIRKYTDLAGKIGYDGNIKDFMNAAADYKEIGASDDMIKQALKVENSKDNTVGGASHQKMLDVASLATENGYKKSDILSNKSRSDMEDVVQAQVAEKDRYEVMKNIADLYGAGDFYSNVSRFKKPAISSGNTVVTKTETPKTNTATRKPRQTKKG